MRYKHNFFGKNQALFRNIGKTSLSHGSEQNKNKNKNKNKKQTNKKKT